MGQWMPLLCGGLLPALMEGPQAPTCHGGPARGAEAPPDLPSPPQTPDSGRNQIDLLDVHQVLGLQALPGEKPVDIGGRTPTSPPGA